VYTRTAPAFFSRREQAELRRLVYRAFALRANAGYTDALERIESWYVETLPNVLARPEGRLLD
jgi:hypothetical protein